MNINFQLFMPKLKFSIFTQFFLLSQKTVGKNSLYFPYLTATDISNFRQSVLLYFAIVIVK